MAARAGFCALALGAALIMASGHAMAQADDAAPQADDVAVQAAAVEEPVSPQPAVALDEPDKSDLDQSALRVPPVISRPRPTRASAIALPKIIGTYR